MNRVNCTATLFLVAWLSLCAPLAAAVGEWIQFGELIPDDSSGGDFFGCSVDLSGNIAIIGAYGNADEGTETGAAYLFDISTGEQLGKLVRSDIAAGDRFGFSVAISGTTAIVGSYRDDDAGNSSGSAYLFNTETLVQQKIDPDDPTANKLFG